VFAKRFLQMLGLLLVFVTLLSACGPAAETPVPAEPTEVEVQPTEEAPEPVEEKLLIAGVVFQSDTFMQTVQAGIQAAADEGDVEVILGNTENDLTKESSMIDDYITRGVDAIVITPISADGSVAALKKAKEAGITIICFNTCVSEEGIASAYLVTKNEDLGMKTGEAAVKFIQEELGGEAKIGIRCRGHAPGEPRHQPAVVGQRRRNGGPCAGSPVVRFGGRGVCLWHRHEQPDGTDAAVG